MDPVTCRNGQISRATGRARTGRAVEIGPHSRRVGHRKIGHATGFHAGTAAGFLIRTTRDALQQQGVTVRHPLIGKAKRESPLSQVVPWCVEEGLATQADSSQNQGKYKIHGRGLESGSIRVYKGTSLGGAPDLGDTTGLGDTTDPHYM